MINELPDLALSPVHYISNLEQLSKTDQWQLTSYHLLSESADEMKQRIPSNWDCSFPIIIN